ncbi:MAG: amidohydrolase [Peptoniphilus sp.]|uniref:amidohydrolase n=1 Tax=Peptoniphilus sp. TaxID=1971214 RepID=UPI0025FAF1C6|nr:amidohydrolase [Peptoniphilus sp.]MCI5643137.1 amidohydrolase [Peptoniphilus sp.]MDD7352264.1 amidohydrolase [Peptoniphilaceae bacterium]
MKKLFYNGKVYVNRDEFQEAIYTEDEFIKEVGKSKDLLEKYSDSAIEKIDCNGKTVIPGLNDSHLHFMQFGESRNQVDIEGVKSIEEMIERCKIFMEKNPKRCEKGIHAIGWNQDLFVGDKRIPNRFDLDKISTEIPIVLERVCGHIVSSNTRVIEILGLTKDSPQYPDGEFLIGEDGYPSGVYTANACNFAKDVIPDFTLEERREMLIETMDYAISCGLTSVQSNDVGTTFMNGPVAFALLKDIYKSYKKIRYRHQVCFNDFSEFEKYLTVGEFKSEDYKDNYLKLGPLKLFKDGSLGARTALMRNGYNDDKENHGLPWIKDEEMRKYVKLASDNNLQVITHVIGDKAIEDTVKCYEESFKNGKNSLRHTLVHCQITDKELVERIAKDDICVMAQPIFLDYDMKVVEDRCGKELASTSYAFKSLKDLGAHVAYGTDAPVENLNPFPNIYMAVTRKDKLGEPEGGFYPKECVDVYEAIDAYTIESAYVEFAEDIKGRIKKDFLADFVVLDRDIFTIDPMEIKEIKPLMTIVGGKIVYKR